MSAHCNDCGTDLVYGAGEDWQLMTCPVCTLREENNLLRAIANAADLYADLLGTVHVDTEAAAYNKIIDALDAWKEHRG